MLVIAATFSAVQSATPNIIGIDGYYHIKVAHLMWQQGWRLLSPLDFPWLQLTILGPGRYSDHHFLFHALQAPFAAGDPRVGAKMAAVLFATLGLYTLYTFLARAGVRYPLLWVAVLIAGAPTFLWRHSMARPQSLFLALLVAAIWAVFAGRPRLLLPLGFLAAWLFDGFPFLVGIPLAAVGAHLACALAGRVVRPSGAHDGVAGPAAGDGPHDAAAAPAVPHARDAGAATAPPAVAGAAPGAPPSPDASAASGGRARAVSMGFEAPAARADRLAAPRSRLGHGAARAALGWAILGVTLGLLLHPYAPRNLEFAYLHLLPKAVPSEQLDVPVGQEWSPFSPSGFVRRAGVAAALTALGLVPPLLALARRRAPDWRTVTLAGLALVFLVMAARSQRLIEYFPAFALLCCAWSWAHPSSTALADLAHVLARALSFARARRGRTGREPAPLLAAAEPDEMPPRPPAAAPAQLAGVGAVGAAGLAGSDVAGSAVPPVPDWVGRGQHPRPSSSGGTPLSSRHGGTTGDLPPRIGSAETQSAAVGARGVGEPAGGPSPSARGRGRVARLVSWWPRLAPWWPRLAPWWPRLAPWRPYLAAGLLAPVLVNSVLLAGRDARNGLAWDTFREPALWLARNTPAGARVLTADWDDFPHMFFWNTHNTYLVGLDPTYLSIYDADLYRRWREVVGGRVRSPSRAIRDTFGASYVVSDLQPKHAAFVRAMTADPAMEEVLRTESVVLFRIRDASR